MDGNSESNFNLTTPDGIKKWQETLQLMYQTTQVLVTSNNHLPITSRHMSINIYVQIDAGWTVCISKSYVHKSIRDQLQ